MKKLVIIAGATGVGKTIIIESTHIGYLIEFIIGESLSASKL